MVEQPCPAHQMVKQDGGAWLPSKPECSFLIQVLLYHIATSANKYYPLGKKEIKLNSVSLISNYVYNMHSMFKSDRTVGEMMAHFFIPSEVIYF